jgi:hypothetical protein
MKFVTTRRQIPDGSLQMTVLKIRLNRVGQLAGLAGVTVSAPRVASPFTSKPHLRSSTETCFNGVAPSTQRQLENWHAGSELSARTK